MRVKGARRTSLSLLSRSRYVPSPTVAGRVEKRAVSQRFINILLPLRASHWGHFVCIGVHFKDGVRCA